MTVKEMGPAIGASPPALFMFGGASCAEKKEAPREPPRRRDPAGGQC